MWDSINKYFQVINDKMFIQCILMMIIRCCHKCITEENMKPFKNCTRFIYCAVSEADFKLTTNNDLVSIRAYELHMSHIKCSNVSIHKNVKLMQLRKDFFYQ